MKNTSDLCKQIPLPEENCHVHHNADFRVRPTIKVLQHPPPREPTNYLIVEFKLAYSLLARNGQWGTTGQDYPWGWPIVFVHLSGDVIRPAVARLTSPKKWPHDPGSTNGRQVNPTCRDPDLSRYFTIWDHFSDPISSFVTD